MKVSATIVVAMCTALASSAWADGVVNVNINPSAPFNASGTPGGGFRLTHVSGFVGQMGGRGGTANSFITFCVELTEFVADGQYNAVISDRASSRPSNPISATTAALYTQFRKGGDFGIAAIADNPWSTSFTDSLQRALWKSEGILAASGAANHGYNTDTRAQAMVAWANLMVADSPNYGSKVRVLQMTRVSNSQMGQDLLTLIPLPSAGGLALAGLMVVGARRRRSV